MTNVATPTPSRALERLRDGQRSQKDAKGS
jgi:hypothetical protein